MTARLIFAWAISSAIVGYIVFDAQGGDLEDFGAYVWLRDRFEIKLLAARTRRMSKRTTKEPPMCQCCEPEPLMFDVVQVTGQDGLHLMPSLVQALEAHDHPVLEICCGNAKLSGLAVAVLRDRKIEELRAEALCRDCYDVAFGCFVLGMKDITPADIISSGDSAL
jgi:hypothetical protein